MNNFLKDFLKTILVIVAVFLFVYYVKPFKNGSFDNSEYLKKDSLENRLKQIQDSISNMNKRLYELKVQNIKQAEQTELNIKKIIEQQKQKEHEKETAHQGIINSSDSADWEWFNRRFAK